MWTKFWDMHSGGGLKESPYEVIFIEASEEKAKVIFYDLFGHDPTEVGCDCCGENYALNENESLEQLTAYHRHCEGAHFFVDDDTESSTDLEYDHTERVWKCDGRSVTFKYVERPDMSLIKYGATKKKCVERYQSLTKYLESPTVLVIRSPQH